jgi:hypothetical protein
MGLGIRLTKLALLTRNILILSALVVPVIVSNNICEHEGDHSKKTEKNCELFIHGSWA